MYGLFFCPFFAEFGDFALKPCIISLYLSSGGFMKIEVLDQIHCKCSSAEVVSAIAPCLRYTDVLWFDGQYSKIPKKIDRYAIEKRPMLFLTGLLDHVKDFINKKGLDIEIVDPYKTLKRRKRTPKKKLGNKTFRPDQLGLLGKILDKRRGIISSPTGSGKTVLAGGIIFNEFPKNRSLFLVHSKDLLMQTKEAFEEFSDEEIVIYGAGNKLDNRWKTERVVVAIVNTFVKVDFKEFLKNPFATIIIDEVHKVSKKKGMFGKLLLHSLANVRIGFSGTPSKGVSAERFAQEGLVGPVIGELTMKKSMKIGITAKVKLELLPIPFNKSFAAKYTSATDLYMYGVKRNRIRNTMLAKTAKKTIDSGGSVLIMIRELDHGKRIQEVLEVHGIKPKFIHGATKLEERMKVKRLLEKKKCLCVVASSIWKEAINIVSLNHIIDASCYKKESAVIQIIGRGTRIAKGKTEVKVTDFLDPYRILAERCVARLQA